MTNSVFSPFYLPPFLFSPFFSSSSIFPSLSFTSSLFFLILVSFSSASLPSFSPLPLFPLPSFSPSLHPIFFSLHSTLSPPPPIFLSFPLHFYLFSFFLFLPHFLLIFFLPLLSPPLHPPSIPSCLHYNHSSDDLTMQVTSE